MDGWDAISYVLAQGNLLNLEKLEIKNCRELQEVFRLEGGEQQNVFLSKLKKMLLHHLLELRCIWKGPSQLINLNNLEDLQVFGCKKLIHLFTPTLARGLQKLKCLEIKWCDELENLIAKDEQDWILSDDQLQPLYFSKLKTVKVKECNKLKYLFPVTITCNLLELWSLKVEGASQLVEVFAHEDEGDIVVQKYAMLPKLECITLERLPSLVNFGPRNRRAIMPNLYSLEVQSCPNISRSFAPTPEKSVHVNEEVPAINLAVLINNIKDKVYF